MKEEKPFNILLIEDDDDHAEVIKFYIRESADDAVVRRVSDGERAMAFLHEREKTMLPHLILLDLKMPRFDGHEILLEIKRLPNLQPIPVVVFTTSNSSADIEKALRQGANSYIVKPIEEKRFGEMMKTIILYWKMNERVRGEKAWQ